MNLFGRVILLGLLGATCGPASAETHARFFSGAGGQYLWSPGLILDAFATTYGSVELPFADKQLKPSSVSQGVPPVIKASYISIDDVTRFSLGNMSSRVWTRPRVLSKIGAMSSPNTASFYRFNKDFAGCDRFRQQYLHSGLPRFSGVRTIIEIDNFVKGRMAYRSEGMSDRWVNYAGEVLSGTKVGGDCDDAAITAAALAICGGAPADSIGFAIFNAQTYGKQGANHIVATYTDERGVTVAFGDTNDGVVWNLADRNVRPKFSASAADISVWLEH